MGRYFVVIIVGGENNTLNIGKANHTCTFKTNKEKNGAINETNKKR